MIWGDNLANLRQRPSGIPPGGRFVFRGPMKAEKPKPKPAPKKPAQPPAKRTPQRDGLKKFAKGIKVI